MPGSLSQNLQALMGRQINIDSLFQVYHKSLNLPPGGLLTEELFRGGLYKLRYL